MSESSVVERVKGMMGRQLRVHLTDGRVVMGLFDCVDKQGNVILDRALEWKSLAELETERSVGYVLVPGKHIVKAEIEDE